MAYYTGKSVPPNHYTLPLDESYYGLDADESAFFKLQTGIQDEAELKQHLVDVQAKAFAIYPYPCIRRFAFTKLKISRLFSYQSFLNLGKTRSQPIFLDIGCCFGNDIRKAVADGYPADYAIASDLKKEFWELGYELFKTTPETFSVPFIPGDALSENHLAIVPPFTSADPPTAPKPDLKTLTSLNLLHGHVSAIHASSFFHLFPEDTQLHIARALAGLLSPEPGSMIFGEHTGLPIKGVRQLVTEEKGMFCHGPDSWKELWDGVVFEKGTVSVESVLRQIDRPEFTREGQQGAQSYRHAWCVTRL